MLDSPQLGPERLTPSTNHRVLQLRNGRDVANRDSHLFAVGTQLRAESRK